MTLVTLGSIAAGLASTALIGVIGNAVVGGGNTLVMACSFFVACFIFILTKSSSEIGLLRLTQALVTDLRLVLGAKILNTSQKELQKIGKDRLMLILTKDIENFSQAFQILPKTMTNVVLIGACLGYMAILSWGLFLMFAACMFICVGGYLVAERKPLARLAAAREGANALQRAFRDLIEGTRELKINAPRREHFLERNLRGSSVNYAKSFTDGMASYVWYGNVGNILFYQGLAVLLFVIPAIWAESGAVVTQMTLINLYIIRPLGEIMFLIPTLRQAEISFEKVRELDRALTFEAPKPDGADPFGERFDSISLEKVCHQYTGTGGDRFILGPISLEFRPGDVVFLIGGNGTGKTTLAMLLLGLFEPESGQIRLNGTQVTAENAEHYKQRFSAIFSDGYLFEDLPPDSAWEMHDKAQNLLQRFGLPGHVVAEGGKFSTVALSSGQRKRLALVSAYLEDRPIYVFDEWAAEQDPEFKRIFYTEVLPDLKARGKAVVAITHDDGFFACADRTYKLDSGMLIPFRSENREMSDHSTLAQAGRTPATVEG